jgi:hypothetical protein
MALTVKKKFRENLVVAVVVFGVLTFAVATVLYVQGFLVGPAAGENVYFFQTATAWLSIMEKESELSLILGKQRPGGGSLVRDVLKKTQSASITFHIFYNCFSAANTMLMKVVLQKKKVDWIGKFRGFKATLYLNFLGLGCALAEQWALNKAMKTHASEKDMNTSFWILFLFGRFRLSCMFFYSFVMAWAYWKLVKFPAKWGYFVAVRFVANSKLNLPMIYATCSILGNLAVMNVKLRAGLELTLCLHYVGVLASTLFAIGVDAMLKADKENEVREGPQKPTAADKPSTKQKND